MSGSLLNESQRRGLTVALRALERDVAEVERLVLHPPRLALRRHAADLTDEEVRAILDLAGRLRTEIAALAAQFELEPEVVSTRRTIAGRFSLEWSALEGTRPDKLRRYGRVDPALEAALGPGLDRPISLTREVFALAERPAPTAGPPIPGAPPRTGSAPPPPVPGGGPG